METTVLYTGFIYSGYILKAILGDCPVASQANCDLEGRGSTPKAMGVIPAFTVPNVPMKKQIQKASSSSACCSLRLWEQFGDWLFSQSRPRPLRVVSSSQTSDQGVGV